MTPEIAQKVNPIFEYVLELVDCINHRTRDVALSVEKDLIRKDLDALTLATGQKPGDIELIRRAMIYWVDEILTFTSPEWRNMTLEFDYFGEKERAWRFYEFGQQQARNSSSDVIEVWYLCLVLGFEGGIDEAFRERLHQPMPGGGQKSSDARIAWAEELARLIRKTRPEEKDGQPLTGGVEPLAGSAWLQTMAKCVFVTGFAFVILLAIVLKLNSGK